MCECKDCVLAIYVNLVGANYMLVNNPSQQHMEHKRTCTLF